MLVQSAMTKERRGHFSMRLGTREFIKKPRGLPHSQKRSSALLEANILQGHDLGGITDLDKSTAGATIPLACGPSCLLPRQNSSGW